VLHEGDQALCDASGAPRVRAFIVPAAGAQVLPTWAVIGLCASASQGFEIRDLVVPDTHAFDIDSAAATQPGALYRFPFDALAYVALAANLGGMARLPALVTPLVLERPVGPNRQPLGARPSCSRPCSSSKARAAGARNCSTQRGAGSNATGGGSKRSRCATRRWLRTRAAREAVDGVYPLCGLAAADPRNALNRAWRDLHTVTQHAVLL
jgi:alkylation response protein AidB-like acyl-CoA dehydrogenase